MKKKDFQLQRKYSGTKLFKVELYTHIYYFKSLTEQLEILQRSVLTLAFPSIFSKLDSRKASS